MRIDAHRCASANIGAWPSLTGTIGGFYFWGPYWVIIYISGSLFYEIISQIGGVGDGWVTILWNYFIQFRYRLLPTPLPKEFYFNHLHCYFAHQCFLFRLKIWHFKALTFLNKRYEIRLTPPPFLKLFHKIPLFFERWLP